MVGTCGALPRVVCARHRCHSAQLRHPSDDRRHPTLSTTNAVDRRHLHLRSSIHAGRDGVSGRQIWAAQRVVVGHCVFRGVISNGRNVTHPRVAHCRKACPRRCGGMPDALDAVADRRDVHKPPRTCQGSIDVGGHLLRGSGVRTTAGRPTAQPFPLGIHLFHQRPHLHRPDHRWSRLATAIQGPCPRTH